MTTRKSDPTAAKPAYEPTSAVGSPVNKEVTKTSPDRPADTKAPAANDPLKDESLLGGLLTQLLDAGPRGGRINVQDYMFALVQGLNPRDQLEMMLVSQMAAVHVATLAAGGQLARASAFQHDSAERTFNKLARTFVTQMEALNRYRTGGGQRVVQNVSVNEGGQAIVVQRDANTDA